MKVFKSILAAVIMAALLQCHNVGASEFNPGRIIDDEIFYDAGAMGSASEVQRFIEQHTPPCDTWGTGRSGYGNLTRAQYATRVKGWHGPPYVCLQNYHENPRTGENSFSRGGGAFPGGISAGQIVWDAAQKYQINPQVLLVLLRKESAGPLFADAWPLRSQYTYAMGYGCPDSGPNFSANCQANQAGFYKQVEMAAWQLRKYRNEIKNYNYQPGRVNRILYNPNPACGARDVYIENYATASLYIYTPYVPNDAALAAYPGEAHCGAYGNRNFFYMFKEWFGSTSVNNSLLRSHDNATVYLVGDNVKYPIPNYDTLAALSPLGGVGFVSQSHLDKIPTGHVANRLIHAPDGTIYFYDSGIRLAFTTCAMVQQYGMSCGDGMKLKESQVNRFYHGPRMIHGYKTTNGKWFYIQNGQRREVLDEKSLTLQQYDKSHNILNETAIDHIPYGEPVIRDASLVEDGLGRYRLVSDGVLHDIKNSEYVKKAFQVLGGGTLQQASIDKLKKSSRVVDDYVKTADGNTYLITSQGRKKVPTPHTIPVEPVLVSNEVANALPGDGALGNTIILKASDNGTVYVLESGQKRPIVAMEDVFSIAKTKQPFIAWLSGSTIQKIPTGNTIFSPGRMVKAPSSGTVYVSDGYDTLIPLSHFDQATEIGVESDLRQVDDGVVKKYKISNKVLSPYVHCEGQTYLGISGVLYKMSLPDHRAYRLQSRTCEMLTVKQTTPQFLAGSNGTIYQLENKTVKPIASYQTYLRLGGRVDNTVKISDVSIRMLELGDVVR